MIFDIAGVSFRRGDDDDDDGDDDDKSCYKNLLWMLLVCPDGVCVTSDLRICAPRTRFTRED
eukprot:1683595-Pyramimonas_sp.AAC.1